jgi:hypothetical protein
VQDYEVRCSQKRLFITLHKSFNKIHQYYFLSLSNLFIFLISSAKFHVVVYPPSTLRSTVVSMKYVSIQQGKTYLPLLHTMMHQRGGTQQTPSDPEADQVFLGGPVMSIACENQVSHPRFSSSYCPRMSKYHFRNSLFNIENTHSSVTIYPGLMQLTLIPAEAHSTAIEAARCLTAAFDALYGACG